MPYYLTRVEDAVSEMKLGGPLPEEFYEERYYIMKGPTIAIVLDTAFHKQKGIVNFSFVLHPKEFFKKKVARKVFREHVIPYARAQVGSEDWQELMPGQHFLIDRQRSLVLTAKFYFVDPLKSFGLAVTELEYSGLKDIANQPSGVAKRN